MIQRIQKGNINSSLIWGIIITWLKLFLSMINELLNCFNYLGKSHKNVLNTTIKSNIQLLRVIWYSGIFNDTMTYRALVELNI